MPFVGTVSGGSSIAAADITDAGALGVSLVRSPLTTTFAAQQRLDASLRKAPIAVQSASSSSGWLGETPAAANHLPIARSTSGVVVLYATQAGGYSTGFALHRGIWTTRGFLVSVYGSDVRIYAMNTSSPPNAVLANVVASIGWHAVAWSISADGTTVRYSIDGGAATTATIIDGPLTFIAPDVGDAPHVLYDAASGGSAVPFAYVGLWDAILSDADLALLSASPSAGAPDLDAISGDDPDWEWCASAAVAADRLVIEGVTYSVTATRPLVWAR